MKRLIAALFYLGFVAQASATISCSLPFTLTNGTTADATQVMANYDALVTCFTNAASAGANNDITSLSALTTPIGPNAGGSNVFLAGSSTGTANAQVVAATTPTGFTLTEGYHVVFIASASNTGAMTLNVNSQGVTNVFRMSPSGPQALTGGEVVINSIVEVVYDGTQFELMTVHAQFGGVGPLTNLTSAAPDLGTVPSHNINITGNTTITSFGASASTTFPVYHVQFAGAVTITYNQTTCSTVGNCINTPGGGNIVTAANDNAMLLYLGAGSGGGGNWQIISYQPANGTAVVNPTPLCGASNLKIVNDAGTPNSEIDLTADAAVLVNPTGNVPIYVTAVSVVINDTTNGANGLDTGSLGGVYGTFYFHYLISNGTTTAGLSSLSATSPTMPSGYTYLCRLGATPTDGHANFLRTLQRGRMAQYVVVTSSNTPSLPNIANGPGGTWSATAPTWTAVPITAFVPSTAIEIRIVVTGKYNNQTNGDVALAPNTSYAGYATTNPPLLDLHAGSSDGNDVVGYVSFVLEGTTVAWASSTAGGAMNCLGWIDSVNAN
jgi:hypothetical protein